MHLYRGGQGPVPSRWYYWIGELTRDEDCWSTPRGGSVEQDNERPSQASGGVRWGAAGSQVRRVNASLGAVVRTCRDGTPIDRNRTRD